MATRNQQQAMTATATMKVTRKDPVVMAEMFGAVSAAITGGVLYLTHEWAYLALLIAVAAWVVFWTALLSPRAARKNRARTLRWRARCRLRPGRGYATTAELAVEWSRLSAWRDGGQARPGLGLWARIGSRPSEYAVNLGRGQYLLRLWGQMVEAMLVMSPPRKGKSGVLADRIASHPGGVLATSTRPDLLRLTREQREARGRIHVFNPTRVADVPSTMRFDLIGPCRDIEMAFRMATWLMGGTNQASMEWFESKGQAVLATYLYAAAVIGADIRTVFRWNQMDDHETALKILAEWGTPELHAIAERALEANRTAGSVRDTVELALRWAAIPELADAATPAPGLPVLDVEELALRDGTLHIIGAADENSPLTPLTRALTAYVHHEAGLIGTRSPGEKLARPLLLALDEVTQVAPVDVPGMLADSAGKGLLMVVVAHSISQLEDRYGKAGAETIWAACDVKMLLPGISSEETLQTVSRILGTVDHIGTPVVPVDVLRMLPRYHALVIRSNLSPVIVRIPSVYKRLPARMISACKPRTKRERRQAYGLSTGTVEAQAVTRQPDHDDVFQPIPPAARQLVPGQVEEPGRPQVNGHRVRGRG